MCKMLRVTGASLAPEYSDGDYVLVSKLLMQLRKLSAGDVVVFEMKPHGILIKRVDHVLPGGEEIFVLGTDPRSTDSRMFGTVRVKELLGRVVYHLKRQA